MKDFLSIVGGLSIVIAICLLVAYIISKHEEMDLIDFRTKEIMNEIADMKKRVIVLELEVKKNGKRLDD